MNAGGHVFGPLLDWLVFAPLWSVALALLVGMVLCALLGWYLRRRMADCITPARADQEAHVLSAISGLLALLIGFTFSVAMDRFDQRREQVLEQANAIQTAYLNAQMLPPPHRARFSRILKEYTDLNVEIASQRPGASREKLYPLDDRLTTDMAAAAVAAFPAIQTMDFSSTFEDSVGRVLEAKAAWKDARSAHVPAQVYALLIFYEFVAAGLLGFVLTGRRGRRIAAALLALSGAALTLVIDIDRPVTGGINESQAAMKHLQAFLHKRPPAAFDRFSSPSESAKVPGLD